MLTTCHHVDQTISSFWFLLPLPEVPRFHISVLHWLIPLDISSSICREWSLNVTVFTVFAADCLTNIRNEMSQQLEGFIIQNAIYTPRSRSVFFEIQLTQYCFQYCPTISSSFWMAPISTKWCTPFRDSL